MGGSSKLDILLTATCVCQMIRPESLFELVFVGEKSRNIKDLLTDFLLTYDFTPTSLPALSL